MVQRLSFCFGTPNRSFNAVIFKLRLIPQSEQCLTTLIFKHFGVRIFEAGPIYKLMCGIF